MRAELPWNVAGIPPEAREAARAAARREGLSVGEWLTRRILRSFSGMEEDAMPLERANFGHNLDAWGMPQSSASRRETEDMLARVGRSETESSDAYRRIEEQLKGVARRLDSSERSHSESNRALSRTTQEISITAREQAQAFDQLGINVIALNERMERVERNAASEGVRDAVKALHQGLSRLADQITQTANQSATQVGALATNFEQLTARVGQARVDSEEADKLLAQRIVTVENVGHNNASALESRIDALEDSAQAGTAQLERRIVAIQSGTQADIAAIEQRLTAVQSGAAGEISALEQRLTAAQSGVHADVAALEQRLAAAQSGSHADLASLEQRLIGLQGNAQSGVAALEQRLAQSEKTAQFHTNAIDHALEKIEAAATARASDQVESQRRASYADEAQRRLEEAIARLEMRAPDATMERRIDGIERGLGGLADKLENYDPAAPLQQSLLALTARMESLEKDHNDLLTELRANLTRKPEPQSAFASLSHDFAPQGAFVPPPVEPPPPPPGAFEAPPFAEPHPGFPDRAADPFAHDQDHFTGYAQETADPFAPELGIEPPPLEADAFAAGYGQDSFTAAPAENFLTQARRNARAAAEKAESERQPRSGFNWGANAAAPAPAPVATARPGYLIPVVVALIVVLAVAAGLVLSQRMRPVMPSVQTAVAPPVEKPAPVAPAANQDAFVEAPQASAPVHPRTTSPAAQRMTPPLQPRDVRPSPVKPVPEPVQSAAPRAATAQDKVVQLANANNPVAQTILGLRALDGTAGSAVNLPDAVKYLTVAANQGQAVAQYRLGTLYERGQGVPADSAKAAHWYEAAATQGNRKAMHNLAVAYAGGAAGKKNMAEAARWFAKAASLGLSDSQFNLAVLYERGDGVPQSLLDAYKWYSIAAAAGDAESKARIAVLQTQLGDSDRAAAQKSVATFHAAPLNRSANVPPEPADLG